MLIKGVDVLPHGLINNIPFKLGRKGEKLFSYISYLSERMDFFRNGQVGNPVLHLDVYGTIGTIFNMNITKISEYLKTLGDAAGKLPLYIEDPVDAGEKNRQIELLGKIRQELRHSGCKVKIVADEWCNTFDDIRDFTDAKCYDMVQIKTSDLGGINNIVESVLYCNKNQTESYQGGTCNETDISAKTSVHLALASRPERILVKPGMGFDEGFMIVSNEMNRAIEI